MKRQKAEVVYLLLVEHLLLQLLHHLALVVDLVILQRQTRQLVSSIAHRARCGSAHTNPVSWDVLCGNKCQFQLLEIERHKITNLNLNLNLACNRYRFPSGSFTRVVAVVEHRQNQQKNKPQSNSEDMRACVEQQICALVCLLKGIISVSLRTTASAY